MGKIVLYAPMISHSGEIFHPIRIERRKGKGMQDRVLKFDAKKLLLRLTPLNSTQDGLSSLFCQSVGTGSGSQSWEGDGPRFLQSHRSSCRRWNLNHTQPGLWGCGGSLSRGPSMLMWVRVSKVLIVFDLGRRLLVAESMGNQSIVERNAPGTWASSSSDSDYFKAIGQVAGCCRMLG